MDIVPIEAKYEAGKIEFLKKPKGVAEGKVLILFRKKRSVRNTESRIIIESIKKAMPEVQLMREGKIPKKNARDILNEL